MASRRMFSLDVVDTDMFLDMPTSTQALYFQLGMRADDDGVVASPKKIVKIVGCAVDDLRLLITKGYVIPFDSGIVVVTHWNINNAVRADRKKPSIYIDELAALTEKGGIYLYTANQLTDTCQPTANQLTDTCQTNDGIGKDRIGKDSIDNILCASVPDDTAKINRKEEANELFEQLWKAYPSKKGKAQVSDTAKARLLKIGYDEMMRAIDRYTYDLEKDSDWRKPQNGSTFFNSGYVDYLDANYKSAEDAQKESDYEKARELERRCWGDVKPIDGDDLPFQYEG